MKLLAGLFTIIISFAAQAEVCYQVSAAKDAWSRTPEILCVDVTTAEGKATVTLKTGLPIAQKTVATFNLELLDRTKCIDCNKDVFGLASPSNSSFNALAIRFDGKRNMTTKSEEGQVMIGTTMFYYRSL